MAEFGDRSGFLEQVRQANFMAGGFLNISEAAVHLNISEDAVKQLVDQRKLFALRDTSGYKFKHEELDRYLEDQKDISQIDATEPKAPHESSLSLDGLELDLSDEATASEEKDTQPKSTDSPANVDEEKPDSGIGIGELELESGLSLADSGNSAGGAAIEATGILPTQEAEASLLIGGDLDGSDLDVPATLLGGSEELSRAEEENDSPHEEGIANAQSIVLGDEIELSGIDVDLSDVGSAASGAAEEPAQSLLLGDSLAGDIESIVASDIFVDEGLASVVLETDGSGSLLVQGSGLKENNEISGIESSGIIDSDPTIEGSDVGSAISGESGVIMEGGLSLEGDEVKAWDVDLGEFLNDIEEDPDAATMLGTANDFDLDAEGSSTDDPSQSADLASSQAGDSMFDKSAGPGDSSFFGEEVGKEANALTAGSDMLSSSQLIGILDDTQFNSLQVTGLICCALLLLLGGLLTFDLVRTIGSSADTSLSNPLVGSLSQLFGWRQ